MKKTFFAILCLLVCGVFIAIGCSDDSDTEAEEVAGELADKLTTAFSFEGGTVKQGDPPAEHAGEADYPQITLANAPDTLAAGVDFELGLQASLDKRKKKATGSDLRFAKFDTPEDATGAIVHVDGANNYIEVTADLDADSLLMTLRGSLGDTADLSGESFTIHVAMLDANGEAGNYETWGLEIKDEATDAQDDDDDDTTSLDDDDDTVSRDDDDDTASLDDDDDTATDDDDDTTADDDDDTARELLWADMDTIFSDRGCKTCHPSPAETTFAVTYETTAGQTSETQGVTMPLVTQFDTSQSFLLFKVNGTQADAGDTNGDEMPPSWDTGNSSTLSQQEIDDIAEWITNGAPEFSTATR